MSQRAEEPPGGAEDFRSLAQALSDGVAVVCGGRLVWANDRLVALSGRRSPAQLVGTAFRDLFKDTGRGLPDAGVSRSLECALQRRGGAVL